MQGQAAKTQSQQGTVDGQDTRSTSSRLCLACAIDARLSALHPVQADSSSLRLPPAEEAEGERHSSKGPQVIKKMQDNSTDIAKNVDSPDAHARNAAKELRHIVQSLRLLLHYLPPDKNQARTLMQRLIYIRKRLDPFAMWELPDSNDGWHIVQSVHFEVLNVLGALELKFGQASTLQSGLPLWCSTLLHDFPATAACLDDYLACLDGAPAKSVHKSCHVEERRSQQLGGMLLLIDRLTNADGA